MADKLNWTEEKVRVGDAELQVVKGGTGKPLLVFHGELGDPGRLSWDSTLAQERTFWIPQHPGFGKSANAIRSLLNAAPETSGKSAKWNWLPRSSMRSGRRQKASA